MHIGPYSVNVTTPLRLCPELGGTAISSGQDLVEYRIDLHGNPEEFLKATLEAIAKGHPAARIDDLMPWNFEKSA